MKNIKLRYNEETNELVLVNPKEQIQQGTTNYYRFAVSDLPVDWSSYATIMVFEVNGDTEYLPLIYGVSEYPNRFNKQLAMKISIIAVKDDSKFQTKKTIIKQVK